MVQRSVGPQKMVTDHGFPFAWLTIGGMRILRSEDFLAYHSFGYSNRSYRFIKHGWNVVDLGAAPGGWLQIAQEAVGKSGTLYV